MHTNTPAETTTTTTVSVCLRCGTIGKSGEMSCCGRGGSWFKNCGGGGNTKLRHTWHEGIQACKARSHSKTIIDHEHRGVQQKDTDSSQRADMASYRAVFAVAKTFTFTSVNTSTSMSYRTPIVTSTYASDNVSITTSTLTLMTNDPTDIEVTSPTHAAVSTSIITRGCVNLMKSLFISIFYYL